MKNIGNGPHVEHAHLLFIGVGTFVKTIETPSKGSIDQSP